MKKLQKLQLKDLAVLNSKEMQHISGGSEPSGVCRRDEEVLYPITYCNYNMECDVKFGYGAYCG